MINNDVDWAIHSIPFSFAFFAISIFLKGSFFSQVCQLMAIHKVLNDSLVLFLHICGLA